MQQSEHPDNQDAYESKTTNIYIQKQENPNSLEINTIQKTTPSEKHKSNNSVTPISRNAMLPKPTDPESWRSRNPDIPALPNSRNHNIRTSRNQQSMNPKTNECLNQEVQQPGNTKLEKCNQIKTLKTSRSRKPTNPKTQTSRTNKTRYLEHL